MEFTINNDYVIKDRQKALQALWIVTRSEEATLENVAEYINAHSDARYYLTNQLKLRLDSSYDTEYVWLDTGYSAPDGSPVMVSFVEDGTSASGGFVGTADTLAEKVMDYHWNYAKEIRKNVSGVKSFLREERKKRRDEALESCHRGLLGLSYNEIIVKAKHYFEGTGDGDPCEDAVCEDAFGAEPSMPAEEVCSVLEEPAQVLETENAVADTTYNRCDDEQMSCGNKETVSSMPVIDGIENVSLAGELSMSKLTDYLACVSDFLKVAFKDKHVEEDYVVFGNKVVVNTGVVCSDGTHLCVLFDEYVAKRVITNRMQLMDEGFSFDAQIPTTPIRFPEVPRITKVNTEVLKQAFLDFANAESFCSDSIVSLAGGEDACYEKIKKALLLTMMMSETDSSVIKKAYINGHAAYMVPLTIGVADTKARLALEYTDEEHCRVARYEDVQKYAIAYSLYSTNA